MENTLIKNSKGSLGQDKEGCNNGDQQLFPTPVLAGSGSTGLLWKHLSLINQAPREQLSEFIISFET